MLGTVQTQLLYEQSTIIVPIYRLKLKDLAQGYTAISGRVGFGITFSPTTLSTVYLRHIFFNHK